MHNQEGQKPYSFISLIAAYFRGVWRRIVEIGRARP